MHKDYLAHPGKDNIWSPRQLRNMKTVPVSESVNKPAHEEFRLGIRTADERHPRTSFGLAKSIHRMQWNRLKLSPCLRYSQGLNHNR
jgi:hypothetical protein